MYTNVYMPQSSRMFMRISLLRSVIFVLFPAQAEVCESVCRLADLRTFALFDSSVQLLPHVFEKEAKNLRGWGQKPVSERKGELETEGHAGGPRQRA